MLGKDGNKYRGKGFGIIDNLPHASQPANPLSVVALAVGSEAVPAVLN